MPGAIVVLAPANFSFAAAAAARYVPGMSEDEAAVRPLRMQDMPESERPREKLMRLGPEALTDAELIAVFLGTGTVGLNAVAVGQSLLERYRTLTAIGKLSWQDLTDQRGIGEVKGLILAAAFDLGRRLAEEQWDNLPMDKPEHVAAYLGPSMRLEPAEVLKVVLLSVRCTLLGVEEITRGTLTETSAHPREVLLPVIRRRAWGFILVHNHPGGDPSPSTADRSFTRRLMEGAQLLQINFLDHIIIGQQTADRPGHFSFRAHGLM